MTFLAPSLESPPKEDLIQLDGRTHALSPAAKTSQLHAKDTGSSGVQATRLTERINHLSEHVKTHPKDHASRRGLLQMVSNRASHLGYLARRDPKRHAALLGALGLRK